MALGSGAGLERLRPVELPDPGGPGPGEIRVKLHASSVNFHDYRVVSGGIPTPEGRIPMADGAGVVESVGDGVAEFAAGDGVVSTFFPDWLRGPPVSVGFGSVPGDGVDGFAREIVVAPATSFTRAPDGWTHTDAATITTAGVTAWRALVVDAEVGRNDVVLVLGTGGVSIFALQIAVGLGAEVIVASSSEEKLEWARSLGATHTIDYRRDPAWGQAVLDRTAGRGADCVVDVGGVGNFPQSLTAVAPGGLVSVIGSLTGFDASFDNRALLFKQVRMKGLIVGSREHQQRCVDTLEELKVRPVVDRRFALGDLRAAFEYQETGRHFGKIAVEW